ncbi:hypothetical protein ALP26_04993 [Pseudomonas savastanoi pv. glycinea]|nr:hypothetical protein ALP26_04993 [Pseudomonas savastanoi pv. glycinea]
MIGQTVQQPPEKLIVVEQLPKTQALLEKERGKV